MGDPGATVPFVDGALHLIWSGPMTSLPHAPITVSGLVDAKQMAASAPVEDDDDEVETLISAAIAKLPTAAQPLVKKARIMPVTTPLVTHPMQPTKSVKKLASPPPVPQLGKPHAIKAAAATRKLQKDAAQIKALCAAANNAPAGLPAAACTGK